jgi:hypothetical protein
MKKLVFFLVLTTLFQHLTALDTIETFNLGFSDMEYYFKVEKTNEENLFTHEFHIGAGITQNLSATLNFINTETEQSYDSSYSFGFIFTVPYLEIIAIDIFAETDNFSSKLIGTEFNYNLKYIGTYLRGEFAKNDKESDFSLSLGLNTTFKNLEILSEFILGDEKTFALGVNYLITENIEIISDINFISKNSYYMTLGFIATLK